MIPNFTQFFNPHLEGINPSSLIKHWNETYAFIKFDKVDPTNNFAEQEIRPSVLMRKTSYGNRSHRGGQNQAVLMSMIRTAQKQGQNFTSETAQKLIH